MSNWPTRVGLVACLIGLLALGMGANLQRLAEDKGKTSAVTVKNSIDNGGGQGSLPADWQAAPAQTAYLDDLEALYGLAKSAGLAVNSVEYGYGPGAPLPVTVRTLNLRFKEDYPRFKAFAAQVLQHMPHAAIQEIQIERKDSSTAQGQVTLKLALIYQLQAAPAGPASSPEAR